MLAANLSDMRIGGKKINSVAVTPPDVGNSSQKNNPNTEQIALNAIPEMFQRLQNELDILSSRISESHEASSYLFARISPVLTVSDTGGIPLSDIPLTPYPGDSAFVQHLSSVIMQLQLQSQILAHLQDRLFSVAALVEL